MKKLIGTVLLGGILVSALMFNLRVQNSEGLRTKKLVGNGSVSAIPVETITPRRWSGNNSLTVIGIVKSEFESVISVKVPSKIIELGATDGGAILLGQSLVKLDTSDVQSQIAVAEAGIQTAKLQLIKATEGKQAREIEMNNQVALAESTLKNAKIRFDQAQLAAKLADSSVRTDAQRSKSTVILAEQGVKQTELALALAQRNVERLEGLLAIGGVALVEVNSARTQRDIAQSQLVSTRAALVQAQDSDRPSAELVPIRNRVNAGEVDIARSAVRDASAALKTAIEARSSAIRIANHDIELAGAGINQAVAARNQSGTSAGPSSIRAPFDGYVTELAVHTGDQVQPGAPLLRLVGSHGLYLECSIPARESSTLSAGISVAWETDEVVMTRGKGKVDRISTVSTDGASLSVRIHPDVEDNLKPGQSIKVTLPIVTKNALSIPLDSVRYEGSRAFVYCVASGRSVRRFVSVGTSTGTDLQIVGGLSVVDFVIKSPSAGLKENVFVQSSTTK